jgi:hypothetical protein
MPRWVRVIGWSAVVWTLAIAAAAAVVALTGDCADVAADDFHVCELDRSSTVSGLVLLWFIVFLPLAVVWVLGRTRRARCRICGDELGATDRRVCRRCAARLIETAEPR